MRVSQKRHPRLFLRGEGASEADVGGLVGEGD